MKGELRANNVMEWKGRAGRGRGRGVRVGA